MKLLLSLLLVGAALAENVPFSSPLYYQIARLSPGENVVMSPASIESCLGLLYMGAKNTTAKELHDVLQLPGITKDEVGQHFGEYMDKIKNSGVELKTANRVYLSNRFDVLPKYNELTSKYFGTQAEKVDFGKPETAANINAWIEDQTNKKIKGMVDANSFDETTSAVLINAIYFKATWKYKFEEDETVDMDFHISADQKVSVKTMHQTVSVNYGNFPLLGVTGFELPYDKTDISMMILLPYKVDGLAAFKEKLNHVNLTDLFFLKSKVHLQIPKFKIEFGASLNEVLKNVGLKKMFHGNFTGLTATNEPLAISEVKHKAFIEIDEKGTEAAAASGAGIIGPFPGLPPPTIIVDHPFFFAIKDNKTIYFAGHVSKL